MQPKEQPTVICPFRPVTQAWREGCVLGMLHSTPVEAILRVQLSVVISCMD